jgi:phage gp46-like protein
MDIRTVHDNHDGVRMDYQIAAPGLAADDGLESAVLISLYTDRRAEADDTLPDDNADRRGWWGDSYADTVGDRIGSKLWLLRREKAKAEVLMRAKQYASEALQWLLDDAVVRAVDVVAEWQQLDAGGRTLALQVTLRRNDNSTVKYRFADFWEGIHGT